MQRSVLHLLACLSVVAVLIAAVLHPRPVQQLQNRLPEAAPYDTQEARYFPPPYEQTWETEANPGRCATCHSTVFSEWNGSMMANSWRDPAWRAAFLLMARITATDGDCDIPEPPDGSARSALNPFADDGCSSRFDLGHGHQVTIGSGSLLDGFCSRCHMPANYTDNVPLENVKVDPESGREHGALNPRFDPTSDEGTGIAFARVDSEVRNTPAGERGIFCAVCHTMTESRDTPFHSYSKSGDEYEPALGQAARAELITDGRADPDVAPAPETPNLGYGIGAGSYRLSPHGISTSTFFGPMRSGGPEGEIDTYTSQVFGVDLPHEVGQFKKHTGFQNVKYQRAEMCAACHDVTNPLPIRNAVGKWVGGFPIERTYTEWLGSRYADRAGNANFDADFKRDCQTCHMQQDYGQPGTAQTLYRDGRAVPPRTGALADSGPQRSIAYSHHFIGGNAYVTRLIGRDVDEVGDVQPYPKLSTFSFSSADPESPYHYAYWMGVDEKGAPSQHARLAWDRLRNALELQLTAAPAPDADGRIPLVLKVTNSGCGHNFPSGFPEGRNAWVAVHAFDLATGRELEIHDSHWDRTSRGVGDLTDREMVDPNFPGCEWKLPAGSADPYSYQIKAVASKGDGCPTLDLVYATPLNLVTDSEGRPIDRLGKVIGRSNPAGLPQFKDLDGDGDIYDDAFLLDTRLRPLPQPGSSLELDRYSVVVPVGAVGPVAVTAAIYYQSIEGPVARKLLGNLADADGDHRLEPCVLGGPCDGRAPTVEPPVVEGAPPVPMELVDQVVELPDHADRTPPALVATYPRPEATEVYEDPVVKVTFSEPVRGIDSESFTLTDAAGEPVPAFVDQIGDGTWGLFPHRVFLTRGATYTAHLSADICDFADNCLRPSRTWSFRITETVAGGRGATGFPRGFPGYLPPPPDLPPSVAGIETTGDGSVKVTFSEPVMNVTPLTLRVWTAAGSDRSCSGTGVRMPGQISADRDGVTWIFTPDTPVPVGTPCVALAPGIYDLSGQRLAVPFVGRATARAAGEGSAETAPASGG